jgi:hypothetical protein
MKLQVYENPTKKDPVVRLKLEDGGDGEINLYAVDEEGEGVDCGLLLRFKSNGKILRMASVNSDLGFALDDDEHIEFEDE